MEIVKAIATEAQVHENGPWMIPEPAYIPNGNESGRVLVIGIGGSTLRLTMVYVHNRTADSSILYSSEIPTFIKKDEGFFSWCAHNLLPHLDRVTAQFQKIKIALSWSFPLRNTSIISSMGKEFTSIFNGKDILTLFNEQLKPHYKIESVTHDGTSSLITGIFNSSSCTMALTLGTGVNLNVISTNDKKTIFVNSEISMLGRSDLIPYVELKEESYDFPGDLSSMFQPFEARVGGLWLGKMASSALGRDISTRDIWTILGRKTMSNEYWTLHRIVKRSALLVASAIYGLHFAFSLKKSHSSFKVAYTGGVIFEPVFQSYLNDELQNMANIFGISVSLEPQKHGSEVGCAIAAIIQNAS